MTALRPLRQAHTPSFPALALQALLALLKAGKVTYICSQNVE